MSAVTEPLKRGWGLKQMGGLWGECAAEFLGTCVLILFGDGVVAMAVAALPGSGRAENATTIFLASGDWLLITWGWAFAVCFGVYIAGGVTGAHLNPAVTLAFAVRRKFPWRKVAPYWGAQLVGAFVGAALVWWNYHDSINAYDKAAAKGGAELVSGHTNATFSIFATFPSPAFNGSMWGPLLDQIIGTALLLLCIAAVVDAKNTIVKANLGPLIIGFSVAAIGMSFGANAGYAINPARDLGPRVLAYFAGFGELALPGTLHGPGGFTGYMWVPIVGPLIGGVIGIVVYDLFIGKALAAREALGAPEEAPEQVPPIDDAE
ncbi:MIP/aquaporin family protein [Flexivirga sp. B27]